MGEIKKVTCVLPCGGVGARMGAGKNKLFLPLLGRSVISYTLRAMEEARLVSEIVLSAKEGEEETLLAACRAAGLTKPVHLAPGGEERQQSVKNGVRLAAHDWVLVHDGARSLILPEEVDRVIEDAFCYGAAAMGVYMKDTVKRVKDGRITVTVPREDLVRIQTPQVFQKKDYLRAAQKAEEEGFVATDECALLERIGIFAALTEGSEENLKLTTPDDLSVAESILLRRGEA